MDKLVIWGSPKKVTEGLLAFREEIGDFGTLLYAGKDWLDRDLGRRSMVLTAEQVLPALNAAIGGAKRRRSSVIPAEREAGEPGPRARGETGGAL